MKNKEINQEETVDLRKFLNVRPDPYDVRAEFTANSSDKDSPILRTLLADIASDAFTTIEYGERNFRLGFYPSGKPCDVTSFKKELKRTGKVYQGENKGIEYKDGKGNRYVKVKAKHVYIFERSHREGNFGHWLKDGQVRFSGHMSRENINYYANPKEVDKYLLNKYGYLLGTKWYKVEPLRWHVYNIMDYKPQPNQIYVDDDSIKLDEFHTGLYLAPIYPNKEEFASAAFIVPASMMKVSQQAYENDVRKLAEHEKAINEASKRRKIELEQNRKSGLKHETEVKENERPFEYTEILNGPEMGM